VFSFGQTADPGWRPQANFDGNRDDGYESAPDYHHDHPVSEVMAEPVE
jgi:hypothetical protein